MSVKELQDYTRIAKYARYNKDAQRRETWVEQVDRVMGMHKEYFGILSESLKEEFEFVTEMLYKKRVLGSQRALQFGGRAILEKHERMYNCSFSYLDRADFFKETMYLCLCGVGVGFSAQTHHIQKLPELELNRTNEIVKYTIPDSIEGWAEALDMVVKSYFVGSDVSGKNIECDYSEIRPAGALIKSSGSKAPGPDGLHRSIDKIIELFDRCVSNGQRKLKSIDAYDIVMHASDAVVSGGIRRAATICLFSPDDDEMMGAKTGNWFVENPQRGRSNNSVLLVRDNVTHEQFKQIFTSVKEYGEPGFIFSNDTEAGYNPCVEIGMYAKTEDTQESGWSFCVSGDTNLITRTSITSIKDSVGIPTEIWNGEEWREVVPFKTGSNRKLYRVHLSDGSHLDCTSNHKWSIKDRFMKDYMEVETKDLMNVSKYPIHTPPPKTKFIDGTFIDFAYEYGYILGDGCAKRTCNGISTPRIPHANIFQIDNELPLRARVVGTGINKYNTSYKTISFDDVDSDFSFKLKYEQGLPHEIFSWDRESVLNFIAGWIDSDGSISSRGIRIYGTDDKMRDLQLLFTKLGIYSSINMHSSKGTVTNYMSRKKDLMYVQVNDICDIHSYKFELSNSMRKVNGRGMYQIIKHVEELPGLHDTYCLEEPKRHLCLFNNVITHQCNLCEINMKKAKTREEFLDACKAAAILGTFQASYTNFPYLGSVTERIVRREALIGVSMTGMMDTPDIAFDPELQREGAELVKSTNTKIASKIGINAAARTTCVKPAGSTSCILGSSSGIHPHHAKRYFRRVQANKLENPLQFFKLYNPTAVEESVWDSNGKTDVITFLCEVPDSAKTKVQIGALELLQYVKLTQNNWVDAGTNLDLCVKPWLRHNVSNTINIKPNEWDEVCDYIYHNRNSYAGISLLPISGDKDYPQAPFTAIYTPIELVKMYGDPSMMASGLIVHALRTFNNNLWAACDCLLELNTSLINPVITADITEAELNDITDVVFLRKEWIRRAKKFAKNYFTTPEFVNGDIRLMTYLLKDVHNWKTWCDLKREYTNVPWDELTEITDLTKLSETVACSGGKCDTSLEI